jgi:hypothetical protein
MKSSNDLIRRDLLILAAAVTLSAAIYLFASKFTYAIGFPLDDSWIHQTYARNLALRGEWAFHPGIPSAGSTSPLWSMLLAIGFIFGLSPYIWTYFLGGLALFGLAFICEWAVRQIMTAYRPRFPFIGLFIAFEWHLAWAAMSGMETLLHALLMTAVLVMLMTNSRRYLTFGLLTGLAVWVRPDGLTLLGPVAMVILLVEKDNPARACAFVRYLIGFGALFVPYLFFNLVIGGTPMPNTFYAKQAEYAAWQTKPVLERLTQMLLQLLIGPNLALIPGMLGWLILSIQRRAWGSLAALIWCAGYIWLYVSRLPVYQHGRYLMPALPIFFLFGLLGLIEFVLSKMPKGFHWFAQTLWQTIIGAVTCLFIILGARSYAQDVAVIESEMVLTAKWVSENLPADAIIAAHDIGALGYFDFHELIDLAGLVSPDVVPFIRDEPRLALYLNEHGADYLIAFPEFYPALSQIAGKVYVTNSSFAPGFGQENMTVFRWISP